MELTRPGRRRDTIPPGRSLNRDETDQEELDVKANWWCASDPGDPHLNEPKPHSREPQTRLPAMRLVPPPTVDPSSRAPGGIAPKLIGAAIGFCLVYLLRNVLIPIVVAAGLAAVAAPLVRAMESRLRTPRWVAALAAYLGYLTVFTGISLIAARTIVPELALWPEISRRHCIFSSNVFLAGKRCTHLVRR